MSNYVISLGGSLIVPDQIDTEFLKSFRKLILKFVAKGDNFVIVCGGGKVCRRYTAALSEIIKATKEQKDWVGIYATWLNAKFIQAMFKDKAYKDVIIEVDKKLGKVNEKIIVAGGWKPGCSTDNDAVLLAQKFKINNIINLTDIDYVYDKDPKKFSDAKPLKNLTWKEYKKIIGGKWTPGLHLPFDPLASKLAEQLKYSVAILNGTKLKNLNNYLLGRKFTGTVLTK